MLACILVHHHTDCFAQLLETAELFSPNIEILDSDAVLLDLGKEKHPDSTAQAILAQFSRQHSICISIGLAEIRYVADVAARLAGPMGYQLVPKGKEKSFLASQSVNLLPVESETLRRLHLLGLQSMKDVAALPKKHLVRQFGDEGKLIYDRVRGIDPTPLNLMAYEEPLSRQLEFDPPLNGGEQLLHAVMEACEELFERLEQQYKLCTQIQLRLVLENGDAAVAPVNFASPLHDAERAQKLIKTRVEHLQLPAAITSVTVTLAGLVAGHAHQMSLFDCTPEQERRRSIQRVADQIAAKRKGTSIMQVVWRDPLSRIPERRAHLQDLVHKPISRPLCLPRPLKVAADARGLPNVVRVQEGWVPVDTVVESWELDEDWWTARPVMRSYYRVVLNNGMIMRLFRDRKQGGWYRQQV